MQALATAQAAAPERSLEQRMEALRRANGVRSHRAELKQDMKRGVRLAADAVAEPEDDLATMKVFDLLLAAPKVGRVKANKWLAACGISPSKTLAGLSERQRRALVAVLRRGSPGSGPVRRW